MAGKVDCVRGAAFCSALTSSFSRGAHRRATYNSLVSRIRLLATVLSVALLCGPAGAVDRFDSRTTASLTTLLDEAVRDADPPGLVAMVVNRERVLFEHATGALSVAGPVPMRADALFRIHSMTKPITSVAALMLVDEGRLDLEAPVSAYLPAFAAPQVITAMNADGTAVTRPAKNPLKVRHLLTHTSGIGYGFSDPTLFQLAARTGKSEIELPLLHEPGERWTYGASTLVVGHIIEKVTGQSLALVVHERVFARLGMVDTFYRVPDDKRARVMSRHQRTGGRLVEEQVAAVEESPVRGDSGLYSTAGDYGRFLQFLLNDGKVGGTRLLSTRAMRLLRESQIGPLTVTTQPDADPSRTRPFPNGAGRDGFSLAFQIAAAPSRGVPGRSRGSMSWGGLRNTHFWIDRDAGIGAVMMTQVLPFYDDEVMRVLGAFEERVYGALD